MPSSFCLPDSYAKIRTALSSFSTHASPQREEVRTAATSLPTSLPVRGRGEEATLEHLLDDLTPGFNGSKTSANYYGFVTGGVLPIAEAADNIVTAWDQNVQVHLPDFSVSTLVENRALTMLLELLDLVISEEADTLKGGKWLGRTFTTGATSSNVLGLACGREAVLAQRIAARSEDTEPKVVSVSELGILEACRLAGVDTIQVLTSMAHSSIYKAASIIGIGRSLVKEVGQTDTNTPWKFDMEALEWALQRPGTASIIAVSCGEVNTGRFATSNHADMAQLRALCDKYGAWLHVDGAFGLFSRALPQKAEFAALRDTCAGVELADSIAGDAHKSLNVPYDCGFFFTHSLETLSEVFQNPNAAYLMSSSSSTAGEEVPSVLNIGIENSRRFRALPVYAVLIAHGREGLADMLARQVYLARSVAAFIAESEHYELLPDPTAAAEDIGIIVLFRAVNPGLNCSLVTRINANKKIYVSGTTWRTEPACRIAVSTWKVNVGRDLAIIRGVLLDVANAVCK